jgi:hypothetical protein
LSAIIISAESSDQCTLVPYLMKSIRFSKNIFLIGYLALLLLGLTFCISGYSFTFAPLDILLVLLIVSHPVIKFIQSGIHVWLKIIIGTGIIISLIIMFWNLPVAVAYGREATIRTIREWDLDKYRVTLAQKQGWAGGPYLQYDLIRYRSFRLVNKTIATGHPYSGEESYCKVNLKEDYYSDQVLFEFDSCNRALKKFPGHND